MLKNYEITQGHFTLWPKFKRPLISINEIARNQEFSLFILEARIQRPSSYMVVLFDPSFDKNDGLTKEVWVG